MAVSRTLDAQALYWHLVARGFHVSRDEDVLVVEPPDLLTAGLIPAIQAHKWELLDLVSVLDEEPATRFQSPAPSISTSITRRISVEPTPLRPTLPADLPRMCCVPTVCTRLGPCERAPACNAMEG